MINSMYLIGSTLMLAQSKFTAFLLTASEWPSLIHKEFPAFKAAFSCHTKLSASTYEPMSSGSSSPVYRLRIGPDYRYAVVDTYGILVHKDDWTKELYIADISWIYVKVSWLG